MLLEYFDIEKNGQRLGPDRQFLAAALSVSWYRRPSR